MITPLRSSIVYRSTTQKTNLFNCPETPNARLNNPTDLTSLSLSLIFQQVLFNNEELTSLSLWTHLFLYLFLSFYLSFYRPLLTVFLHPSIPSASLLFNQLINLPVDLSLCVCLLLCLHLFSKLFFLLPSFFLYQSLAPFTCSSTTYSRMRWWKVNMASRKRMMLCILWTLECLWLNGGCQKDLNSLRP